jgi:tetratricopeptide (TPR) repeat protein
MCLAGSVPGCLCDAVSSPLSPVEAELRRIRGLVEAKRPAEALAAAEILRRDVPENRDVLYIAAVCHRRLGQYQPALQTLDRLQALHPGYSRAFQERGHLLAAMNQPEQALDAYLHAVGINPALPGAWRALELLFRAAGRAEEAETAAGHVARLRTLAPAVVTATGLFSDGETHEAERIIRAHLKANPTDVEAMRLLARIGIRLEIFDDAEFLLDSVLVFAPDYHPARYDYVRVLLQRHRHRKALEEAEILLKADPTNRDWRAIHAAAHLSLGHYEDAIAAYSALCAEIPTADLELSIGHAHKTCGRQPEAIAAYRQAARLRPDFGDAWWSLANLKTYRFSQADIGIMRAQESAAATDENDRIHLCFALGKALEDAGDYAASFSYYARGNALKKAETRYRPEPIEANAAAQKSLFTPAFLQSRAGAGCPLADPIFIVGLPRAGSTLLEQILASHSQVEGTMELADISRLVHRLQGRGPVETARYPEILAELSPDRLRDFGEKYLSDTRIYRSGKPFFIDKNPNNFRHLGLIHLILPNARVIDARREPMACCFSNFKQLFASGQEFTYSLEDIARYYRTYESLMAHWTGILPGKILLVQHEDVVDNLEVNVRRLLDFCGLPFEPQCLDFHKTERGIRTASSEQVRRPIFREGLDQWRHYAPWLTPLQLALSRKAAEE